MATQRFYDGQPGPDIRRELNNLEAVFDDAIANARGPRGWTPVVAVVTDGARSVLRITDWTGGEGSKPTVTGFIGATGIVATAALAVDIRGSIGATGPSNTLAIGTVTSDASPSATITGTSPNQTLNLVLPKGDKGDTGNTGPANTLTIGTVTTGAASATITGTAPNQTLNLVLPKGDKGDAGSNGAAATITVGTVTTGAPGTSATVVNSGTSSAAVFDFTIPRGDTGASGAGTGDVVGPATAVNNSVALFDGTTGKLLKDGGVLGTAAFESATSFATSSQGLLADTAVQPGDLATVATTGAYSDVTGKPTLGTASGLNVAATGNAATGEVVKGDDTRLSDSRPPTGAAGGVLSGSYPNPGFAVDMATQAELNVVSGVANSKLSDAPSDGKTYGRKNAAWVEASGGGMPSYTYDQRGDLRASGGQFAVVDGLGLFQHVAGSDEPDDDESCFATATGRWLLQAVHWDVVDTWQLPDDEARDAYDEDEPLRFASKVLTGSATCAITSVASVSSTSFTGSVTGAAPGDRVIATPPAALGVSAVETGRLSYHAWVSANNTVTVMLTNGSAAAAITNAAVQTAWPVTVIKS